MQCPWHVPQTRSTATALSRAQSGNQSGPHARKPKPPPCRQCGLTPRSSGAPTAGRLARTLGSAVAASWYFGAVLETAQLRRPVAAEDQTAETGFAGNAGRAKESMSRASIGSAERDQVLAHDTNQVWRVSGLSSWRANFPGCFRQVSPQPEEEGFVRRSLHARLSFLPQGQSRSSTSRPAPRLSQEALPNPSLKPRPNGKTPGPRYSAVHHLQRGPGVLPSVPA
jgi:hypothetical protein